MATDARTIRLAPDTYELLAREAERRGIDPDTLADELVRSDLGTPATGDLERVLAGLARVREQLPEIDAVSLIREGRHELEDRSA